MKRFSYLLVLVLFTILTFCEDSPTSNDQIKSDFLLEVNLKDANNNALAGYTVSVWNDFFGSEALFKIGNKKNIKAATQIKFMLPSRSNIQLKIYDLDNELYDTLIDNEILNAGTFQYLFSHPNNIGTQVLKIVLDAKEDSQNDPSNYIDSIYTVMIAPDPEIAKIGVTDKSGTFSNTNKLLFPHLYNLPEFIRTSESGPEGLGTFTLNSQYIICFTHPQTNKAEYFSRQIEDGENIFEFTAGTGKSFNILAKENHFIQDKLFKTKDDSVSVPSEYKLYQNYPNPFN